jgi:hypothetical protein
VKYGDWLTINGIISFTSNLIHIRDGLNTSTPIGGINVNNKKTEFKLWVTNLDEDMKYLQLLGFKPAYLRLDPDSNQILVINGMYYVNKVERSNFDCRTTTQIYRPEWDVEGATHYSSRTNTYLRYETVNINTTMYVVYRWFNEEWVRVRANKFSTVHSHIIPNPNRVKAEMSSVPKIPTELVNTYKAVVPEVQVADSGYSHYVRHFNGVKLDPYRIFDLYQITNPCVQHAMKKLFALGKRGAKDELKDLQEVIDTLERMKEMLSDK